MQVARNHRRTSAGDAASHHHGFGGGGRSVIHRGVGEVHAGEFGDHGLELEDGLQSTLRKLRLVGRVGSKKFSALHKRVNDYGR